VQLLPVDSGVYNIINFVVPGQTVWLEPTNAAHITRLDTTPDVPGQALNIAVQTAGASGQTVTAIVSTGGQTVANSSATVGSSVRLSIPNPRLWSPDDPFLYDLRVTLSSGDVVTGYFGMRTVGTAIVNGFLRPVLNGRFLFQMGSLDQGYWPDGIYTAPTDAALHFDLAQQKALGFNTVRKVRLPCPCCNCRLTPRAAHQGRACTLVLPR
jgi:beta-galactosidase/beta-glucuronidase